MEPSDDSQETNLPSSHFGVLSGHGGGASFRIRIVDYIGAFTLAKQLESTSKKALKTSDGKSNVTILPPAEYAERFVQAMEGYFIGCPVSGFVGLQGTVETITEETPWELERGKELSALLPSVL